MASQEDGEISGCLFQGFKLLLDQFISPAWTVSYHIFFLFSWYLAKYLPQQCVTEAAAGTSKEGVCLPGLMLWNNIKRASLSCDSVLALNLQNAFLCTVQLEILRVTLVSTDEDKAELQ